MSMGRRIRVYREAKGWSQAELAYELTRVKERGSKVTRVSVSNWENGKEFPRHDNIRALARVFSKPETDFQRFGGDTATLVDPSGRHFIPLLKMCQLKHVGEGGMIRGSARNIAQLEVDKSIPRHAFGIVIKDTSMATRFMPGEEVIIDPTVLPLDNPDDPDFVLARVNDVQQFVFRLYRKRGPDAFDLVAFHKDCKTISSTPNDPVVLLGTMIEHRRKRRR